MTTQLIENKQQTKLQIHRDQAESSQIDPLSHWETLPEALGLHSIRNGRFQTPLRQNLNPMIPQDDANKKERDLSRGDWFLISPWKERLAQTERPWLNDNFLMKLFQR